MARLPEKERDIVRRAFDWRFDGLQRFLVRGHNFFNSPCSSRQGCGSSGKSEAICRNSASASPSHRSVTVRCARLSRIGAELGASSPPPQSLNSCHQNRPAPRRALPRLFQLSQSAGSDDQRPPHSRLDGSLIIAVICARNPRNLSRRRVGSARASSDGQQVQSLFVAAERDQRVGKVDAQRLGSAGTRIMSDAQMADPAHRAGRTAPKHSQHGIERSDVAALRPSARSPIGQASVQLSTAASPMACRMVCAVIRSSNGRVAMGGF